MEEVDDDDDVVRPNDEEEEDEEEEMDDDDDSAVASPEATTPATRGTVTTPATGATRAASPNTNMKIVAVAEINIGKNYREIGKEALCWQLSSAKPGNGVEQIRDGSTNTYWQSDGVKQPHWIQVHFARRVAISHVCLYLDYALDESYTPKRVSVHHGMTSQDLQSAVYPADAEIEFSEPNGWCIVPLSAPPDPLDVYHEQQSTSNNVIRAHLLRISILNMHQNGRDTHVRQVALFGPRRDDIAVVPKPVPMELDATFDDEGDDDNDWQTMRWTGFEAVVR